MDKELAFCLSGYGWWEITAPNTDNNNISINSVGMSKCSIGHYFTNLVQSPGAGTHLLQVLALTWWNACTHLMKCLLVRTRYRWENLQQRDRDTRLLLKSSSLFLPPPFMFSCWLIYDQPFFSIILQVLLFNFLQLFSSFLMPSCTWLNYRFLYFQEFERNVICQEDYWP